MKNIIYTTVLTLFMLNTSYAGEGVTSPKNHITNFNGLYYGVEIGYSNANANAYSHTNLSSYGAFTYNSDPYGYLAGLNLGYNIKVSPSMLIGIELGYDDRMSANDRTTADSTHFNRVKVKNSIDVISKVGYLLNESTLLYTVGGYQGTDIESTFSQPAASTSMTSTTRRGGYTLGLGLERKISDNMTYKFEYRHSKSNNLKEDFSNAFNSCSSADCWEDQYFDEHTLRLGVKFYF
jgi:opacity protein-like surface antigen